MESIFSFKKGKKGRENDRKTKEKKMLVFEIINGKIFSKMGSRRGETEKIMVFGLREQFKRKGISVDFEHQPSETRVNGHTSQLSLIINIGKTLKKWPGRKLHT
jgi:hypothetical protein